MKNPKLLRESQSLTLNQKIDHTIGSVEAFAAGTGRSFLNGELYVSFSGGKDSTVLLDLIRRFMDPGMIAVFCNTGVEYPEVVKFVKATENVEIIYPEKNFRGILKQYGFPLISKETAHGIRQCRSTKSEKLMSLRLNGRSEDKKKQGKIADKWQFLITEDFSVSEQCCYWLKKKPFAKYRKDTGRLPFIATMADESDLRMEQYINRGGCNSFKPGKEASYPLSIWTDEDVYEYAKRYNVKLVDLYEKGARRTGCMACGFGVHLEKTNRFEMLYDLHPAIYRAFLKFENNGVPYREALKKCGVLLPDECRQMKMDF